MQHIVDMVITVLVAFLVSCLRKGKLRLVQKQYVATTLFLLIWLAAIAGILAVPDEYIRILTFLDAITCAACALMVVSILLLTIAFVFHYDKLPRGYYALYVLPIITAIIVFTNPWHHLFYREFSIYSQKVRFGPLFILSGSQYYAYCLVSIILSVRCGLKNRNSSMMWQSYLFAGGLIVPVIVNILATLKIVDLSIAATPIAFVFTIICNGIAIYYLNFLNIKPIALQRVMNNIADGYAILTSDGQIINMNDSSQMIIGKGYGIKENVYLSKAAASLEEEGKKKVIQNLLEHFVMCKQTASVITYEQEIVKDGRQFFYAVELTPIFTAKKLMGVILLLKDVTRLKEEMKQQQEKLSREMERERLASLGEMIGGISHNLKTPIMSISGSAECLETLITEYTESLGDEEITVEDYLEIGNDMREWTRKIKESCSYMSDIITTVKGLAANLNANHVIDFTVEEVFRRVFLLMRHSLMKYNCRLIVDNKLSPSVRLQGDINNLVQVVNNLVDNAKDAMKESGGDIVLRAEQKDKNVLISVEDSGGGISPEIKDKIFHSMVTTKGAMGTGLGLYSSAGIIRGKFNGSMWAENRQEGGAVFYIELPVKR